MLHKLEPRSAGVVRVVIRVNMTSLQLHSAGALLSHCWAGSPIVKIIQTSVIPCWKGIDRRFQKMEG